MSFRARLNVAKGASLGRIFTGTGIDAATWQALAIAPPHGGAFGTGADAGAGSAGDGALSVILEGLSGLGVDTSNIHGWNKGLSVPTIAAAGGALFGTGYHMQYADGALIPLPTFSRLVAADWSLAGPLDPRGTGDQNAVFFLTGHGTPALYPADSAYQVWARNPADQSVSGGTGGVAITADKGYPFPLLFKSSGDGFSFERLEVLHGGAVIDFDYQP